ncbi:MAG: TonB-dependent receptor family protein [Solimonas sp.]
MTDTATRPPLDARDPIRRAIARCPLALLSALGLSPVAALAQSEAPAAMPTVLVTADAAQQAKAELEAEQALTPGGVTLVDGEDLQRREVSNLADMLRYVPGAWAAGGSTGDSAFFSIRGSNLDATNYDGNGVKLMQDGLPVTTADGNNHNRMIDPLGARYIVVARGANALTYGASTLGGAIDFISPTARDSAPLEVFLNGGSGQQLQGRITAGAVAGDLDGLITVEGRHYDGYREHQEQDRQSVYANAGWRIGNAVQTRLYDSYIDNDQQLPGALTRAQWSQDPEQAEADAVTGDYQYNVRTWRIADKTVWTIDADSSLSVGLSYENQLLYHPIVYAPPYFSLLINTEQRTAGASLRYELRLGQHQLLAGLNYAQTQNEGGNYAYEPGMRGDMTTRVDNHADSAELFLVDRWQFAPQWTVIYGAQGILSSRDVKNTEVATGILRNPKGDFDSVNPRVGVIHQLTPDIELFANVSRLYEAPDNFELQDDTRGNDEVLDAMRGTVVEFGTRGTKALPAGDRWHWDVALYYARLRDEILSIDDPSKPGTGNSLSTNVDDTIHAGLETLVGASFALDADGRHRIEPLLNLTVNHFVVDGDRHYGGNDLPAAPKYALRGEVLYRNSNGFFAGPTFDAIGKRWADFDNSYRVGSYALLGLRAGLGRRDWEVYGEIRNLADRNYISYFSVKDVAGPDDAILTPGEPRSAFIGARLRFY